MADNPVRPRPPRVGAPPGCLRRSPRLIELPSFTIGADTGGAGEVHYRAPVHAATVVFTAHPRSASRIDAGPVLVQDQPPGASHLVPAGTEFWTAWHEDAAWVQLTIAPAALASLEAELPGRWPMVGEPLLDHVDPDLTALAGPIGRNLADPSVLDRLYLETLGLAWVLRLRSARAHAPPALPETSAAALPPARLRQVRAYVAENLGGDLTLAALAAVAGLSRWHFLRSFRAATGLTPAAFVRAQRVEAAAGLLRGSRLPMAAVAARSGLGGMDQLYRAFRTELGTTPGQVRRGSGARR